MKEETVSHYLKHPDLGVLTFTEVFQKDEKVTKFVESYVKDEKGNKVRDPNILEEIKSLGIIY
jgi:hypothetical protein